VKHVIAIAGLLFAFTAHAQVTCQTSPPNPSGGTTTTCSDGSVSSATQPQALGSVATGMQQAQQAQADQMQTIANAKLAAEQAELVREQREALQEQRQAAAAEAARRAAANDQQRPAEAPQTNSGMARERLAAALAATPTEKLKAGAATLEAIMRSAPPDSQAFHNAVRSLQATNEELVKRGALK
jgi:hypothetical protein